jgi:catechol 2,3-dioxygenase-like lactoylglutathione lyase family enzyme
VDSINHVKIVTPDPEAIDRFLREVVEFPEGWQYGSVAEDGGAAQASPAASDTAVPSDASMLDRALELQRGGMDGGFVTGSARSKQFQIRRGEQAAVWAIALGTRYVERAHQRCVELHIPCTDINVVPWGEGNLRVFFAEVGGVVFEVMRVEPKDTSVSE